MSGIQIEHKNESDAPVYEDVKHVSRGEHWLTFTYKVNEERWGAMIPVRNIRVVREWYE